MNLKKILHSQIVVYKSIIYALSYVTLFYILSKVLKNFFESHNNTGFCKLFTNDEKKLYTYIKTYTLE